MQGRHRSCQPTSSKTGSFHTGAKSFHFDYQIYAPVSNMTRIKKASGTCEFMCFGIFRKFHSRPRSFFTIFLFLFNFFKSCAGLSQPQETSLFNRASTLLKGMLASAKKKVQSLQQLGQAKSSNMCVHIIESYL